MLVLGCFSNIIPQGKVSIMAKAKYGKFWLEIEIPVPGFDPLVPVFNTTVGIFNILKYNLHFAKDKSDKLYVYEGGVYRLIKDDLFQCYAALILDRVVWRSANYNELVIYVTGQAPYLLEQPLEDRINLLNGIYYILEDRFESHEVDHSDYLTTTQLPIKYDPKAVCPNIDTFMKEIFPEGPDLLYDVIGLCMTSVTGQAKAVILLGSGSNGKSIFLYGLRAAIGLSNCSNILMHTLADKYDKFSTSGLVGKLANVADDMSHQKLMETATIKSIISGNPIRVEGKFKSSYTYTPFCKLVFGSNHRLTSEDTTTGYARRMMHIPFDKTFPPNPGKERELHAMFHHPEELSGMLNEILKRLKVTVTEGLIIPDTARELVDSYTPIDGKDESIIKDLLVEDPEGKVPIHGFHVECSGWGYSGSRTVLKAHMKYLFPMAKYGRPRIDGIQVPCFMGVKIKDNTTEHRINFCTVPEGVIADIDYLDN